MKFDRKPYAYFVTDSPEIYLFAVDIEETWLDELAQRLGAKEEPPRAGIKIWKFDRKRLAMAKGLGVGFTVKECFEQFVKEREQKTTWLNGD